MAVYRETSRYNFTELQYGSLAALYTALIAHSQHIVPISKKLFAGPFPGDFSTTLLSPRLDLETLQDSPRGFRNVVLGDNSLDLLSSDVGEHSSQIG